jgi:hypothetical protein
MTHPPSLQGITPLHRYYEAVRPSHRKSGAFVVLLRSQLARVGASIDQPDIHVAHILIVAWIYQRLEKHRIRQGNRRAGQCKLPNLVTGLTSSPVSSFPLRGQAHGPKDRGESEMSGWRGRMVIPEAFETKEQQFGD